MMKRLVLCAFASAIALQAQMAHCAPVDDQSTIRQGEYLARVGDCVACHTAPGAKPFAGGLPMTTPMGAIYSTNITPDRDTGIGQYTEAEFSRAMREGVARDGHNLYPAMPYPSFARMSDADIHALYIYFMNGIAPVRQANRSGDIPFPLNARWPLKLWNIFFLNNGRYAANALHGVEWNRGAYLVQGLGHCGACHTPRGVAFQEKALDDGGRGYLSGAALDGWSAPDLTSSYNTGLGRWTASELAEFLRTGTNPHATAFGPMASVVTNSTQWLSDSDVRSVVTYVKSLAPAHAHDGIPYTYKDSGLQQVLLTRSTFTPGAVIYGQFCVHCHGADGLGRTSTLAPLAGNPNTLDPDASSLIQVVLDGSEPLVIGGLPAPYNMPPMGMMLTDTQISDVLTLIRSNWGNRAAPVSSVDVSRIRNTSETKPR
ncbi:UNVERIFIED_ORG: mono/diheme cytochrome c family protein [Paraburkholderia sediminicola]|nr:mono/diheme cytochrome c family protein [Paraburkholderia sediminicola]